MFDVRELDHLHNDLHQAHQMIHDRLTGPDRIPFGPDWDMAHETACALTAAMIKVGALIVRNDELARADVIGETYPVYDDDRG
jgi:hypothetical protein